MKDNLRRWFTATIYFPTHNYEVWHPPIIRLKTTKVLNSRFCVPIHGRRGSKIHASINMQLQITATYNYTFY